MGVDVNCCRRPQNLGKKDLKTFRGINQKKKPNLSSSNIEEEDSFKIYNPKKKSNDNYLNSIYEANNNFKNFGNYNMDPINDQMNSNKSPFPLIQNQEYMSQPPLENAQYANSYTTIPQQNIIPNTQYVEALPSPQYIQSVPEYQPKTNNYIQTLPPKYISVEPINNIYKASDYSNIQSYENNNYNSYNNYSSKNNYSDNQTTEYINNNDNFLQNDYNDNNSNFYYQNEKSYPVEYATQTKHQSNYFESSSNNIQYSEDNTNYFSNYETQPTYVEEEQSYYNIPSNHIHSTNHIIYNSEPYQQIYSESQNIQENIEYVESEPKIIKTKYICKPKKYIEKVQYIEPETQIQQIMYAPKKNKPKHFKNEKEDEDEDEEFNNFQKEYIKSKNKLQKYHDLEIESKVNNYDEIKSKKRNNKFHEERRINIKDEESVSENENQSQSEMEEEFNDGEFEKEKIDDVLIIKSTNIEKNKQNTACQVPGFISNFLSKIF